MTIEPKEIAEKLAALREAAAVSVGEGTYHGAFENGWQAAYTDALPIIEAQHVMLKEALDRFDALLQGDSLCSVDEKLVDRITAALEPKHDK